MKPPQTILLPTAMQEQGELFTVPQLPAMRAAKLLVRLGAVLAPALSSLEGGLDADIGPALAGMLQGLDPDTFEAILKELCYGTKVGVVDLSAPGVFDQCFTGQLKSMQKFLIFALEVNFQDFFGGLAEKGKALMAGALASKSSGSTGTPGTSIG